MFSPRLALLAFALVLVLAPSALAAAPDSSVWSRDLHAPQGALTAPDGSLWVSDHNGGFCRTTAPTWRSSGTLQHPLVATQDTTRTCLGGLLPEAQPGPDAAIDPILVDRDGVADSGDEMAFIADTATHSADIVRARWNKDTDLFEFDGVIKMDADPAWVERSRPTGLTVDAENRLYVVFQRSQTVQRITRGWTTQPLVEIVARIQGRRGAGVAARQVAPGAPVKLYISELAGLSQVTPDAVTQPTAEDGPDVGTFVDGADGVLPNAVEAMHYVAREDALYVGTANAGLPADAGSDNVLRYDLKAADLLGNDPLVGYKPSIFATGFSSPAGVDGGATDAELLVTDDPGLLGDVEQLGTGLLHVIGRDVAHVTGPRDTQEHRPAFEVTGATECSIVLRTDADASWKPCATGPLQPEADLADGEYVVSVRSGTGIVESLAFEVDDTDPAEASITSPTLVDSDADGQQDDPPVLSRRPYFTFASSEEGIRSWRCSRDGGAFEPCAQGRLAADWTATAPGAEPHTLAIKAVDAAGNESPASAVLTFTVDPALRVGADPVAWPATPDFTDSTARIGGGLHLATGAITDPNGRTWVTDHNAGFCRMAEPTLGTAEVEHPQTTLDTDATRTCLGGLLPFAGTGPDAAGQPAFLDPTPADPGSGDELAFIPDEASHSNQIVRAQWSPEDGLFRFKDTIAVASDKPRPTNASIGPDGALYVVKKEEDTIERFADPAGPSPRPVVVGHAASGEAMSIAAGRATPGGPTVVYLGESEGVTRFTPAPGTTTTDAPTATAVPFTLPARPALAPDAHVEGGFAVTYDLQRDRLYAGTSFGTTMADAGSDRVHRVQLGARTVVEPDFSTGHSMIGGLGVRPDGKVFVVDDSALLDPEEPMGTGRLFLAGLPAAHVSQGPVNDAGDLSSPNRAFTNVTRPSFRVTGTQGATLECAFVRPGTTTIAADDWTGCGQGGRYAVNEVLAEGTYVLAVRATVGGTRGLVEAHRFTVDTTIPANPAITSPQPGTGTATAPLPAEPTVGFTSEAGATFECRLYREGTQASEWAECAPGRLPAFTESARWTLDVQAVDRAGNRSAGHATTTFSVDGVLPTVEFTQPERGASTNAASFTLNWRLSEEMERVECRVTEGQTAPAGAAGWTPCTTTTSTTLTAGQVDRTFLVEVRAIDRAGNVGPVNDRLVTFDRQIPVIDVTGPAEGQTIDMPGVLRFTTSEAIAAECRLDGGVWQTCASPTRLERLAPGAHTIEVRGSDPAGNAAAPVTRSFRVSQTPPADDGGNNDGLNELRGNGGGDAAATPVITPTPPATGGGTPTPTPGTGASANGIAPPPLQLSLTLSVPQLFKNGLPMVITTGAGQPFVQIQVVQLGATGTTAQAAAKKAAKRKVVTTLLKRWPRAGAHVLVLKSGKVRRMKPGRYVVEVKAGKSRRDLERLSSKRFRVRR